LPDMNRILPLIISLICFLNAQQFAGVDHIINSAIAGHIFPGATVIIGTDSSILHHQSYGNFTYNTSSTVVDTNHLFDLASCTKVFATTSCIMKLVDSGLVDINEYVGTYIPAFAQNGKGNVRVKNLLLHDSGLPAYYSPSASQSPNQIIQAIYALPLINPIGTYLYSCLNFVTLMKVVEAVTGSPMYQFYQAEITDPLVMNRTMFVPPDSLYSQCLPTSSVNGYQGVVHDPLARGLDGYSGNAGLFSSTGDLAKICQVLLNNGVYAGQMVFSAATVNLFTTRYDPSGSTRALGWGTNASGATSAGSLFSLNSFGHTGYTGTSVWCDPVRNLFVVFLTNRVYPDDSASVTSTRQQVHDAAVRAVEGIPPQAVLNYLGREDNSDLVVSWSSNQIMGPVDSTAVWLNIDGEFELYGNYTAGTDELVLPASLFPVDSLIRVRLINTYQNTVSDNSDTYAIRGWKNQLLIVDGYDRIGSWGQPYHNFAIIHALALPDTVHFTSCDNSQIVSGSVDLNDFKYVIWISADESTADETLSSAEQNLVKDFLEQGGCLFISGSEIGWDLGRTTSSTADRQFYNNYLHAGYVGDDSGNMSVYGSAGSPLAGLTFQYGTASALYIEDYPDYITPVNGSAVCLEYGNSRKAGVYYTGLFGDGSVVGKVVYLGFPFETIVGSDNRYALLYRVIGFFQEEMVGTQADDQMNIPETLVLNQNYPNPFNPVTNISYRLPRQSEVQIIICDVLGRQVRRITTGVQGPGYQTVTWNSTNDRGQSVSAGVYFYQIRVHDPDAIGASNFTQTRKMILLK